MSTFDYFFAWHTGQVWGNLVASAITVSLALIWGMRKYIKHEEHKEAVHQARHEELLAHFNHKEGEIL